MYFQNLKKCQRSKINFVKKFKILNVSIYIKNIISDFYLYSKNGLISETEKGRSALTYHDTSHEFVMVLPAVPHHSPGKKQKNLSKIKN